MTTKRKPTYTRIAPRPILLVGDNADDSALIHKLLNRSGLANPLEWQRNPEAALAYLADHDAPVLILLDLHFPGYMSGADFFRRIRAISKTQYTPVIVLTDSAHDMSELLGLGAVAYFTKPVTAQMIIGTLWQIGLKWYICE